MFGSIALALRIVNNEVLLVQRVEANAEKVEELLISVVSGKHGSVPINS